MFRTKILSSSLAITLFAAIALTMTVASAPLGAEVKIGYVDVEKAVMATQDGKDAKSRLENIVKKSEEEFKTKLGEFKAMEEQLAKQVQLMSDDMKRQKLQEYQQRGLELQQRYQQEQQKLMQEQETAFEPIISKLRAAIQGIGLSEGYTIILEKRGDGVLYAMPQLDLTAKVVAKYKTTK